MSLAAGLPVLLWWCCFSRLWSRSLLFGWLVENRVAARASANSGRWAAGYFFQSLVLIGVVADVVCGVVISVNLCSFVASNRQNYTVKSLCILPSLVDRVKNRIGSIRIALGVCCSPIWPAMWYFYDIINILQRLKICMSTEYISVYRSKIIIVC